MLYLKETLIPTLYIYVRYIIQTQHIWSPLSPNLEPTHSSYIGTYGQSADFLIVLKKETKCTHQLVDLGEEDLLIQGNNRKVREELKGGLLAKSGKLIFWRAKSKEMATLFLKNLIVSKRSLGHTDHLYTYKGHVEHIYKKCRKFIT